MQGARKAALALHGLHEDDAAWILSRVSSEQRQTLNGMLGDLRELGIPAEADFLSHALTDGIGETKDQHADHREIIRAASPLRMFAVLSGEAITVVALILRCEVWPWRDPYLAMLQPMSRDRLLDLLQEEGDVPPLSLRRALLAAVARRVGKAESSDTAVKWDWRRRVRQLFRSLQS